jgi:hypothetical protein
MLTLLVYSTQIKAEHSLAWPNLYVYRRQVPLVSHFEQAAGVLLPSQVKWIFHLSKQCKKMGSHICFNIQIHYPIFIKKTRSTKGRVIFTEYWKSDGTESLQS